MHQLKIGFLGGGNMATALIDGLLAAGHAPERLRVSEPDAARAALLAARGVEVVEAAALGEGIDLVVLAVKPQQAAAALAGLRLPAGSSLLSIAAGLRVDALQALVGDDVHVIRSMPNTPAQVGAGATGVWAPASVPPSAREQAGYLLGAAGQVHWVESESLLDAVTAVSGSGPAYVFLLSELMARAGTELGLSADTADALARQTIIGAARLLAADSAPAATLRQRVTSPGGTTAAALASFERDALPAVVSRALRAAADRAAELASELAATPTTRP